MNEALRISMLVGMLIFGPVCDISAVESEARTALAERGRLVTAFQQRGAEAVPTLFDALDSDSRLVQLTAVHLLGEIGDAAEPALANALTHPNHAVRLVAIDALTEAGNLTGHWSTILMDNHPEVRRKVKLSLLKSRSLPTGDALVRLISDLMARYVSAPPDERVYVLKLLSSFDTLPPQGRLMLVAATRDGSDRVRAAAYEAVLKHIERDWSSAADLLASARNDSSADIRQLGQQMRWELKSVYQTRLPRSGWRFRKDEADVGRDERWYASGYDNSGWRSDVPIEASWQDHLQRDYHGAAWYRREIDVPQLNSWDRAFLSFLGVDEQAWVWVNGQAVGAHAVGPGGWNEPFLIDVTPALKPGRTNQITVRAQNTTGGGGIWRPVWLRVINTKQLAQHED